MSTIYVNQDSFAQNTVRELKENDFWLDSKTPIALKSNKVHLVLIYNPQNVDPGYIELWQRLGQTLSGIVVAAINESARTEIMEAFQNVRLDVDNPLHPYTRFSGTTILLWRNSWPQAFYNGVLSYPTIVEWITNRAVIPGYKQMYSMFNGYNGLDEEEPIADDRIEGFVYPYESRDYTNNKIGRVANENSNQVDEGADYTISETAQQQEEEEGVDYANNNTDVYQEQYGRVCEGPGCDEESAYDNSTNVNADGNEYTNLDKYRTYNNEFSSVGKYNNNATMTANAGRTNYRETVADVGYLPDE